MTVTASVPPAAHPASGMGHVRSWPQRRGTVATRVPGGYRVDGVIGWHSGWGLTDVLWLGAVDETSEEYVFGIADLHDARISGRIRPGTAWSAWRCAAPGPGPCRGVLPGPGPGAGGAGGALRDLHPNLVLKK
ncbi:hypothetical protein [Actinoplanes subglobosus]|uniref:Uncharacterized protein n=1 Tax=Actinoplanes subglobosus TaxID=1547892 RepID=A0ABV8J2L8_9ACTN